MNVLLFENFKLPFPIDHADIDLRGEAEDRSNAVGVAAANARAASDEACRGAWATIALIAEASIGSTIGNPELLSWSTSFLAGERVLGGIVPFVLASLAPAEMRVLVSHLLAERVGAMALIVNALMATPDPYRYPCERLVVEHPDPEVRQHYFALLGTHQRLVPPGSLDRSRLSAAHGADVLRVGITDPDPRVRERAIALAYGIGLVDDVRAEIVRTTDDVDATVRCYALVALGVLGDVATRDLLISHLRGEGRDEVCAAIAALARRPDGIDVVLSSLPDARPWYNDAAFASIGEVATPLDDAALERLAGLAADDRARSMLDRHRRRTRHPDGQEVGPDGRIEIVRRPG